MDLKKTINLDLEKISGLVYIPDYITVDEQNNLFAIIEQQEWSSKTNRRVQHYGYKYDYKNGAFASAAYLGVLPDWAQNLVNRFYRDGITASIFEQLIVNEYQPGQGIVSHIDCIPCFGNTIITLSLGSDCVMDFTHSQIGEKAQILLQSGSLLVFQQDARYVWQHGIKGQNRDNYQGKEFTRGRRVSLTFREVLFPYK
ncbi:MAG: alpha-ketoglutarate-dependent dioxygenase AlkB [Cyanobacteriota bacterium]